MRMMYNDDTGEDPATTRGNKPVKKSARKRQEREREAAERWQVRRNYLSRQLGNNPWVMSSAHALFESFFAKTLTSWNSHASQQTTLPKRKKGKDRKKVEVNSARRRELRSHLRVTFTNLREVLADFVSAQSGEMQNQWLQLLLASPKQSNSEVLGIFWFQVVDGGIISPNEAVAEALCTTFCLVEGDEEVALAVEYVARTLVTATTFWTQHGLNIECFGVEGKLPETYETKVAILSPGDRNVAVWRQAVDVRVSAFLASRGVVVPYTS